MLRKDTVFKKELVASTRHIQIVGTVNATAFHFPCHSHPRHHISRFPFVMIHIQTKIIFMA